MSSEFPDASKKCHLELRVAVKEDLGVVLPDGRGITRPQGEFPLLELDLALGIVELPADLRELEGVHALPQNDIQDHQVPGLVRVNLHKFET